MVAIQIPPRTVRLLCILGEPSQEQRLGIWLIHMFNQRPRLVGVNSRLEHGPAPPTFSVSSEGQNRNWCYASCCRGERRGFPGSFARLREDRYLQCQRGEREASCSAVLASRSQTR